MGEKIKDLLDAAKGTVGEILVEDAVPALATEVIKGTALEAATGIVGAVSPRIGGIMIAYKQKRWESNWEKYIAEIVRRQEEINERLKNIEKENIDKFKKDIFPIVSDYVLDEKQEEKIKYIVNGFVNLASGKNLQDDVVIMYYDTLEQINLLDIRVLKCYVQNRLIGDSAGETLIDIMEKCDIDTGQMNLIREKLVRLGLLESRNEADMDKNVHAIGQYLQDVKNNKKNPTLKLKRISKSESYRATVYGRKVINFFLENYSPEA